MKAIVVEKPGGPEVLKPVDVDEKTPRRNEALVKLEAVGMNRIDIWIRSGLYKVSLPRIIGADGAGVVEAVGEDVTNVAAGDRVLIDPAITCGRCRFCLRGFDSLCENHRLLGHGIDGTYAEKIVVPAINLHHVPRELSTVQAACIMVNYATIWHALVTRAGLAPGSTVLVIGAGSGVGVAAVQMCKLFGCTVVATVGDDWKAEKAYRIGADYVVNRRKRSISEAVNEYTGGRGVDLVVEHAGQAVWDEAVKSLSPGGKLVYLGATSGESAAINIRYTYRRQHSFIGSYGWNKHEIPHVIQLFDKGLLRPIIHTTYPLTEAAEAHRLMESDNFFGKIILIP
ncbi:MAG: zinc-binding dehydrogenase [Candidatus Caldarchaeum sp.]|nr:zinc-binding dehydrogenase [Candidatus Caldarchaeum sp.]MCX8200926.1 zinc-binding dehydrogenase [Candidatus Caldarchaeum sp.]MDW8063812.1 zinc-binding dehydrogenase [Candidatus Caldarchaeum sp.]MDW8434754.1 zinc-binding dehydrogenase [Candidatus Caldarchaeum sp.]